MKIALVAALFVMPAAANATSLELICHGTALHSESSQTFAHASDSDGSSASASATTYRTARTAEVTRVTLDDRGGGRLRLPASLIPPISTGKDGWWDFIKLEVSEDTIRGQFSLNILNKPKVLIDRRTGEIDMKGLGMRFQGACERAPEPAAERKF